MDRTKSATPARELSHRVGHLEERDLQAYSVLTETGPVLQIGEIEFTEEVWNRVPRHCLWFAIELHQCGYWGPIEDVDYESNDQSLDNGGSIVSRWAFVNVPSFWITTDSSGQRSRTSVFISPESD